MVKDKILIITGSYPPDICGVGDYTRKLYEALNHGAFDFEIFYKKQWKLSLLFSYLKEIKSKQPSLIHIQYPTEGYGYSFLPLLLAMFLPTSKLIITIHELSSRTFKARIYTILLILQAKIIIVTNEIEQAYIMKVSFLKNKNVKIINIGSNIPRSVNALKKYADRETDVAYFGHIRPIKGIESFITMAEYFKEDKAATTFSIIGQSVPGYESYLKNLSIQASSLDVKLILNRSMEETAENLSDCKIAYLPFPDGVSNRRGSLLACIQNGCIIVTTKSQYKEFNDFFSPACYLVDSNQQALHIIEQILMRVDTEKNTSDLIDVFSWDNIAKEHFAVYISLSNE